MRSRLLDLCAESARGLGFEPSVTVSGPIDTEMTELVSGNVLAVVREGLSNVAHHAHATNVHVDLTVSDHRARLVVSDNGVGISSVAGPGRRGLANMSDRAKVLGGTFEVVPVEPSGTEIHLELPLVS